MYVPVSGPEFGIQVEQIILIKRALYVLLASGADWYRHFLVTLRPIGFSPTIFDRDVWIKPDESGDHYEYICTYVSNFMIVYKAPEIIMNLIKK